MGGSGFIRRFTSDPGLSVITAIEGVVIIDNAPPAQVVGVGSGMVTVVGEFEDGPFNTPYQVGSTADFLNTFGGFGFTYGTTTANYPCACSRKADSAIVPEYWNGNGFIALAQKQFQTLTVVRADTSVGSVQFAGCASLSGSASPTFALTTGGQLDLYGFSAVTFTGTPAYVTGTSTSFPVSLSGGEYLEFAIDGTTYTATFTAGSKSEADFLRVVNIAAGYTAFAGTSTLTLTGRIGGTSGSVQIIAGSASLLTASGFSAGSAIPGAGNVANIAAVTFAEVSSLVGTATSNAVSVTRDSSGNLRLNNVGTPLTGTLTVTSCTGVTGLGFTVNQTASAIPTSNQTIPAGTVVSDGTHYWVTMQSVAIASGNAGSYTVKVRPAVDDGTSIGANASTVTTVPTPISGPTFWAVTNSYPLTDALTEPAIDVAYQAALNATTNISNVVSKTNIIVSARQSNAIRVALRSNADFASANGCSGRMAIIRPPLGTTTRAIASSTVAQPGVGTYRDQRVIYAYPGVNVNIPQIAAVGIAGGTGFTATGNIDVGADMWLACIMSNLNPEENPGQETTFAQNVLGLEVGNSDVQILAMGDYINFKASGIAAPRMTDGVCIFESGVTSVDPSQNFNLRNIARQRMADYIEDSLAKTLNTFAKLLPTAQRRSAIMSLINSFMGDLLGTTNGLPQRIADYNADGKSQNTTDTIAAGVYRVALSVKTLSSMDDIVLNATIGETVTVQQQ
jgi:hypothetical protein